MGGANRMQTADKAPDTLQSVAIFKLGRTSAVAGKHREPETGEFMQAAPVDHQRRHGRDFMLGELGDKGMLFKDGRIAPTVRTIELGHDQGRRRSASALAGHGVAYRLLDADLIDAVFVAIQGQQASVGAQTDRIERV